MERFNGSSTCPEEEKKIKGEHKGVEIEGHTHTRKEIQKIGHIYVKSEGGTKVKKSRKVNF